MNHKAALAKKLRALQRRLALIEVLTAFLKKHPAVASRTVLFQFRDRIGLRFFDKAFIRPVYVDEKVALRLEKYVEDWEDYAGMVAEKTVCADISRLSRKELDKVLKKVKINLRNTEAEDEEEDEE